MDEITMNEAEIYFEDGELKITYGKGVTICVGMNEKQIELTKQILGTGDFWTVFLGALSNAVDKAKTNNG